MNTTPFGTELAHRIGGTFAADLIRTPGHWIACRPTGRIVLDNTYQLGWRSDGIDAVAARYAVLIAGMEARLPGTPRTGNNKQAA